MNDIEDIHATKASELINNFQSRAAEILTDSAKQFAAAMDALNTVHSEFITDLGALGASTATQIGGRLDTTRQMQEDLMHHFMGTVPIKEPMIRITTRKSVLPDIVDAPQLMDETRSEAAE